MSMGGYPPPGGGSGFGGPGAPPGGSGGWGGPPAGGGGGWGQPPGGAPPGGGWGQPPGGAPPGGGGYGPPPGAGWPPGGGPAPITPYGGGGGGGAVQERNSVAVMLLPIVTCGIYLYYWIYKTSEELRAQTGDTSINPGADLMLTIFTCGLWGMFVEYRNVQKVHALLVQQDPNRKDQSQTILILNLAAFFVGVTGLIATYMVQEELNQLARARALPR